MLAVAPDSTPVLPRWISIVQLLAVSATFVCASTCSALDAGRVLEAKANVIPLVAGRLVLEFY